MHSSRSIYYCQASKVIQDGLDTPDWVKIQWYVHAISGVEIHVFCNICSPLFISTYHTFLFSFASINSLANQLTVHCVLPFNKASEKCFPSQSWPTYEYTPHRASPTVSTSFPTAWKAAPFSLRKAYNHRKWDKKKEKIFPAPSRACSTVRHTDRRSRTASYSIYWHRARLHVEITFHS